MTDERAESRRRGKHRPGPWWWHGFTNRSSRVFLETPWGGRITVMSFTRCGMQGAKPQFQVPFGKPDRNEPYGDGVMQGFEKLVEVDHNGEFFEINHPDARLIQSSPELYDVVADMLAGEPGARDRAEALLGRIDGEDETT